MATQLDVTKLNYDEMYELAMMGKLTLEDIYDYGNSFPINKAMSMTMLTLAKTLGEMNPEK